jgi:hypothetical protein
MLSSSFSPTFFNCFKTVITQCNSYLLARPGILFENSKIGDCWSLVNNDVLLREYQNFILETDKMYTYSRVKESAASKEKTQPLWQCISNKLASKESSSNDRPDIGIYKPINLPIGDTFS